MSEAELRKSLRASAGKLGRGLVVFANPSARLARAGRVQMRPDQGHDLGHARHEVTQLAQVEGALPGIDDVVVIRRG